MTSIGRRLGRDASSGANSVHLPERCTAPVQSAIGAAAIHLEKAVAEERDTRELLAATARSCWRSLTR